MRTLSFLLASLTLLPQAGATTLLKLSMNDMIQQSTSIVRAKVTGSRGAFRGQDVYTYYQLQILETVKPGGARAGTQTEIAVPGGVAGGVRQPVAGAPSLTVGAEYVLFLWTSRSGLTQVIGLSQGLFRTIPNTAADATPGDSTVVRPAATETMLDANGNVASDQTLRLQWSDLRSRIQQQLGAGK
jgi:hypothetical protein